MQLYSKDIWKRTETRQDQQKKHYDKHHRQIYYSPADKNLVILHPINTAKSNKTSKFMLYCDDPCLIFTQKSPTSYVTASLDNPSEAITIYHISALTPFTDTDISQVILLWKRGQPWKATLPQNIDVSNSNSVSSPRHSWIHRKRL